MLVFEDMVMNVYSEVGFDFGFCGVLRFLSRVRSRYLNDFRLDMLSRLVSLGIGGLMYSLVVNNVACVRQSLILGHASGSNRKVESVYY